METSRSTKKFKILSRPPKGDATSTEEKNYTKVNDNDVEKNQYQDQNISGVSKEREEVIKTNDVKPMSIDFKDVLMENEKRRVELDSGKMHAVDPCG